MTKPRVPHRVPVKRHLELSSENILINQKKVNAVINFFLPDFLR
ncbi:hypothetical protein BDD30_3043 [Photorhabdus asymbiotica]|uniref:Transposase n=1 Tax=Photorhabdus asymbiotica TaxID=291112 RepID=A0ABX9SMC9_9GAMM|nr:hypothetical protein BDD30_3043 [Photorhabdus asymbiotica]